MPYCDAIFEFQNYLVIDAKHIYEQKCSFYRRDILWGRDVMRELGPPPKDENYIINDLPDDYSWG